MQTSSSFFWYTILLRQYMKRIIFMLCWTYDQVCVTYWVWKYVVRCACIFPVCCASLLVSMKMLFSSKKKVCVTYWELITFFKSLNSCVLANHLINHLKYYFKIGIKMNLSSLLKASLIRKMLKMWKYYSWVMSLLFDWSNTLIVWQGNKREKKWRTFQFLVHMKL